MVAHMTEMEPITLPLQESSLDYINNTSKWSALAGACVGLGTGYLILQNESQQLLHQPTEILRRIAIPTVSTILASSVGYYAGKSYATYNTQEKTVERQANYAISLHNNMIATSRNVGLDEDQRRQIKNLPFEHFDSRLEVYKGLPVEQHHAPINRRIEYVQDTASKLRAENNMIDNLSTWPHIFTNSPLLNDHRDKADQMNANRERIKHLNSILSHEKLTRWANKIIKDAPEYKTDTLRKNLAQTRCQLEKKEESIRYNLARLASLIQCPLSHIRLNQSTLEYVCSNWSTNYPDTPEGRKNRNAAIAHTKNEISRQISEYQKRNTNYNIQVIDYNKIVTKLPESMSSFIIDNGGSVNELDGRKDNQELLSYNSYLNHDNGDILLHWINSCFSN